MSEVVDMSLDDIIRNNKKSGGFFPNFGGRGRVVPGPGPARTRFTNRFPSRVSPYFAPQAVHFEEKLIEGPDTGEGTKLYISNLDYGVSNEDIKVLFTDVGDLKRYSIHCDKSGRSKGTAEVVFVRQSDALAAMKRYNNVQLDGKPMKIELVGLKLVTPVAMPSTTSSILGSPGFVSQRQEMASGGGGGRGFGRGQRQLRGHFEKISTEDLDADLDNYRREALQIN